MLPDPEHENNPVLGTGGSKTLNELPKHQGMVLFFANERSFFQTIYILWYVESIPIVFFNWHETPKPNSKIITIYSIALILGHHYSSHMICD